MNQGMLVLLLALLGGSNTYAPAGAKQDHQLAKAGTGRLGTISTGHLIRQMHEAIDALQRVEQIGRLADFSTIRKKEEIIREREAEQEDENDSYIGNIRESFGNVADFLAGEDENKGTNALTAYKQDTADTQGVNLGALAGLAGLLGGGGGSQDALMQTIGSLLGSMGTGGSRGSRESGEDEGRGRTDRGSRTNTGGLDVDKLTKMVNLISAINGAGKK